MNKILMLNKLQKHFNFIKDVDFAKFLGIEPQNLSKWKSRNTFDVETLHLKCVGINSEWLLTGKGEMLREKQYIIPEEENNVVNEPNEYDGIDVLKDRNKLLEDRIDLQNETIEMLREKIIDLQEKLEK